VNDEVLNRDIFGHLQSATANQPGVLAELCRDYLAEARSTIVQLRDALARSDAPQVRERAHYLKGSSMMLGARKLSEACATLEGMGRDSNLSDAGLALEEVLATLKEVEDALTEIVGPTVLPTEGSAA
jgi:HPt (histidine-containing phosphotransfer) domain-containing protein